MIDSLSDLMQDKEACQICLVLFETQFVLTPWDSLLNTTPSANLQYDMCFT